MPPDRWELVKLPNKLPKISTELRKSAKMDNSHIMVDHITFGLIGDHRIQAVVGGDGEVVALTMFPPNDEVDATEYWGDLSKTIRDASKKNESLLE